MHLSDYCTMFVSSYVAVFLMGLQSKNVNNGRYIAAIATSAGISLSQFIFVKYASTGSYLALAVCATGGCSGIASSIWFYQNFMEKRKHRG